MVRGCELFGRQTSARQSLAGALGQRNPLLTAGIRLGLPRAGVGRARAVVLAGLGDSIAFLEIGFVGSERRRSECRRSQCQQTADRRDGRIGLLHRFSPWPWVVSEMLRSPVVDRSLRSIISC